MDSKDFRPYLARISKDADAVFFGASSAPCELLIKQYKQSGLRLPVVAIGNVYDESVLRKVGDDALDAVSVLWYSATLDTPANKAFAALYRAKYNTDPSTFAESGYTAGMWFKAAVDSLNGDVSDKEKLLAALQNVHIKDDPRGPIRLDSYGNPIENMYVRKVEKVKGKVQNTVIQTFPNVSQFWKYKPEQFLKQPPYSKEYPVSTHIQLTQ